MSHTPEQARELWCPMVRIARREKIHEERAWSTENGVIVAGCNTDALGGMRIPKSCRCIADKCAMWRWATFDAAPPGSEPGKLVACVKVRAGVGYCGLAGRPEVLV